jgi:hypothetical protein
MTAMRVNRLWFWVLVAVYFAIKMPLGYSLIVANLDSLKNLAPLDTALTVTLAYIVGARLNDAGLNRWIGIGATLLITLVLPIALVFGRLATLPRGVRLTPMGIFDAIGWVPLVLLIATVIWAGTRPSRPELPPGSPW